MDWALKTGGDEVECWRLLKWDLEVWFESLVC